jgi:hypothetical protein
MNLNPGKADPCKKAADTVIKEPGRGMRWLTQGRRVAHLERKKTEGEG